MLNITGIGLSATIIASKTFPAGFTVTEFPDDTDPSDGEDTVVNETGAGLNGDLVSWGKPTKQPLTLNVLPNTPSDDNLEILFRANTNTKSHRSVGDVITLILNYADGSRKTYVNGVPISFNRIKKVTQTGRIATRPYAFDFEDVI